MRQLVHTMFRNNNRSSFHLRWKENFVKHRKVSKYYETDCRSLNNFSPFYSKTNYIKPIEICFFSTHDIRLVLKKKIYQCSFLRLQICSSFTFCFIAFECNSKSFEIFIPVFLLFFLLVVFSGQISKSFLPMNYLSLPTIRVTKIGRVSLGTLPYVVSTFSAGCYSRLGWPVLI